MERKAFELEFDEKQTPLLKSSGKSCLANMLCLGSVSADCFSNSNALIETKLVSRKMKTCGLLEDSSFWNWGIIALPAQLAWRWSAKPRSLSFKPDKPCITEGVYTQA